MIAEIGTLLLGIAALATIAEATLRHRRDRARDRILREINHAVNNVEPGSPPLWARIDTLDGRVACIDGRLEEHAEQDARNFELILDRLPAPRRRAKGAVT